MAQREFGGIHQSMIPKKPAPDLIRGGYRFSERSCSNNEVERDGYSKKGHLALVSNASASSKQRTPAGGSAGLADGGSGHADTPNAGPARAAAVSNFCNHAVRLRYRRGCHGVRRRRDG